MKKNVEDRMNKDNKCICWYCSKCCDKNLCSNVYGITPAGAKKTKQDGIVFCPNFDREIPKPISKKQVLQLTGFKKWTDINQRVSRLQRTLNELRGIRALVDPLNNIEWKKIDYKKILKRCKQ